MYRILVGKPEGKRPLGRPRRRWVDNIRMDLQEVGCGYMDWIGSGASFVKIGSVCVDKILPTFFCTLHPNWVNSLYEIPTKMYIVRVNSGEIGTVETTTHLGVCMNFYAYCDFGEN